MEKRDSRFLRPPAISAAAGAGKSLADPAAGDTAATNLSASSGSSSSTSTSDFLSQLNAAIKRQKAFGSMQSNVPRATRVLVSRGEGANKPGASPSVSQSSEGKVMQPQRGLLGPSRLQNAAPDHKKVARTSGLCSSTQDDCTLATPSTLGNITDTCDRNVGQNHHLMCDADQMLSRNSLVGEAFKKEQFFSVGGPQTRDNFPANQGSHDPNMNHQDLEIADEAVDMDIKYDAVNLHERGTEEACNQNHAEPLTRCSASGSSTAVSLHSGPTPTAQSTQAPQVSRYASPLQIQESAVESCRSVQDHVPQKQHAGVTGVGDWNPHKQQVQNVDNGTTDKAVSGIGSSLTNDQSMSARDGGGSRPSKVEKERRKKNYDSNVFFKVNGKLYQKLGKIGSGGSSEVHKVISAECIIYALKKIKLKGRDYPTAYGFCQEIEYLNKLKGKSNIIQLIDYEVTDKSLLLEDSMSPRKDGRIKDDHYIYMVLEYGEIDLAHMVAQKWKERNSSNMKIDENWLRFYWQQMLEAVSTIHEERIVHSDLKPANFMLVRGSLKLIDFGIAKAIMNDTTNIQRDAQVGTLNYMSPEAFMCNDQDSGGNVIKCGRPSDIWSLGCILYQMVYGKTPFADYKTFWAKYKEVTNRNHKIKYEAVDNPWLIDLMQRCLAWDRDERWRIPQLLQHPFLNPPVPLDLPSIDRDPCGFQDFVRRIRVHWDNPVVARLRSEIEKLGEDQC
ncbi:hypothetical protein ACP4OV_001708 [Aristida adscensionis]